MAETERHLELKRLSTAWLHSQGYDVSATEVRLPLSNYRVDVAGYRAGKRISLEPGDTIVVECKQSRADFLKDAGRESRIDEVRDAVAERVERLREMMAVHLPQCRQRESLFAEFDSYDLSNWRHETWFRLNAELRRLDRRHAFGTKFDRIARYGCARYCYLSLAEGVAREESELPLGWGCLAVRGDRLVVVKEALRLATRPEARLKLLERIARLGSRPKRSV